MDCTHVIELCELNHHDEIEFEIILSDVVLCLVKITLIYVCYKSIATHERLYLFNNDNLFTITNEKHRKTVIF